MHILVFFCFVIHKSNSLSPTPFLNFDLPLSVRLVLFCLLCQSLEAGRPTTAAVLRPWARQAAKFQRYHPSQASSY